MELREGTAAPTPWPQPGARCKVGLSHPPTSDTDSATSGWPGLATELRAVAITAGILYLAGTDLVPPG